MDSLKKKTDAELLALITEKRADLRTFRFGVAGSKTRDVREGRAAKRTVAAALTELRARGIKA